MCDECIFNNNGKCPAIKNGICNLLFKEKDKEDKEKNDLIVEI